MNSGDTKLLAESVKLISKDGRGDIAARRIKANHATLAGSGVQATSSLEAANLYCNAGDKGFKVAKRLGIGKYGHVDSLGQVKIGSVFSQMQDLPQIGEHTSDFSLTEFQGAISQSGACKQGLYLSSEGDILIDNLQGVVTLHTA